MKNYLGGRSLFQSSILPLFFLICLISVLLSVVSNFFLYTDDLFFNHFANRLSVEKIDALLNNRDDLWWLGYLLKPVELFMRSMLIGFCLMTALFFFNIKIDFTNILKIVLLAEVVPLISELIKVLWFTLFQTSYTLTDVQYFTPISVTNLIYKENLEVWMIYPLQLINVFEVAYWLLLAYGLCSITKERYSKMLGLVASSYGVGLLLWVVFVVFLTVSISPT